MPISSLFLFLFPFLLSAGRLARLEFERLRPDEDASGSVECCLRVVVGMTGGARWLSDGNLSPKDWLAFLASASADPTALNASSVSRMSCWMSSDHASGFVFGMLLGALRRCCVPLRPSSRASSKSNVEALTSLLGSTVEGRGDDVLNETLGADDDDSCRC